MYAGFDGFELVLSCLKKLGATGCKLLRVGGRDFILIVAPPEKQKKFQNGLKNLVYVPFEFDRLGPHLTNFE